MEFIILKCDDDVTRMSLFHMQTTSSEDSNCFVNLSNEKLSEISDFLLWKWIESVLVWERKSLRWGKSRPERFLLLPSMLNSLAYRNDLQANANCFAAQVEIIASSLRQSLVSAIWVDFKGRLCRFRFRKWFVFGPLTYYIPFSISFEISMTATIEQFRTKVIRTFNSRSFTNTWNTTSRSLSRQAAEIWEKLEAFVDWIVWIDNQICYHQRFFVRKFTYDLSLWK